MQQYKAEKVNHVNILSYNLKFNKALGELDELVIKHETDIVCIQECYSKKMPSKIGNLHIQGTTKTGHLGLAIYADKQRFSNLHTESCLLEETFYEKILYKKILSQDRERLLFVEFYDNSLKKKIHIASFHATHLVTPNSMRRHQIADAYKKLSRGDEDTPVIMVGDYNYPMFKKQLRYFIESYGYEMLLADRPTYKNLFFKGHFDFVTSLNAQIETVKTLPRGLSDHMPILISAAI